MGIKGRERKKEEKKRDSFPVRLRNDMIQMNSGTKQKEVKKEEKAWPNLQTAKVSRNKYRLPKRE